MPNQINQQTLTWLINDKYHGQISPYLSRDVERLKNGEPLDYLIGFKEFLGCKIDLSQRPFIPRPETEYWAEKALAEIYARKEKNFKCLDIFAGSGCLGLAILKNTQNTTVDFAEIDQGCLRQIKINVKLNQIPAKRYRIISSDIFRNIKGKYDYILANPPYIAHHKTYLVQKSVLEFEPRQALFAEDSGLSVIKKFLAEAARHLKTNGKIYLEFDSWQKPLINKLLIKSGYQNCCFYHDQFKHDQFKRWRYLVIKKG